ncbi:MAG: SpoIIE family protein phosphatase [Acidobacteria bacterium]|nr:SpoIIE family protein phosphatase [Acidobacteriota bacterium]
MSKRLWLMGGCLFFALMLFHAVTNVYGDWLERRNRSERGWEASDKNGQAVIFRVDESGAVAGLQIGDEVIAIKNVAAEKFPLLNRSESRVPSGTAYTVVIRRAGQVREFVLVTVGERWWQRLSDLTILLSDFFFVLIGWIVFLLKPTDRQAVLLALMLGAFSGLIQNSNTNLPRVVYALVLLARLAGAFFFPLFLHFFLAFPTPHALLRRFPSLSKWLYLPLLLSYTPVVGYLSLAFFLQKDNWLQQFPQWLGVIANLVIAGYLVTGLIALVSNYWTANEQARRRLRVMLAGSGLGFLNLLLIFMAALFDSEKRIPWLADYLGVALAVTLPLIPLSFSYAIIRHQVIPVSLIIRSGVRYVLVSRGSVVLGIVVVGVVVTILLTALFNHLRPHPVVNGVCSAVIGVLAWLFFQRFHKRYLAPVIDRHFFRQAYDAQQIVAELTTELRTTTELPQLLSQVATKIHSALPSENVTIFLRSPEAGNFECAFSSDYQPGQVGPLSVKRACTLSGSIADLLLQSDNGVAVNVEPLLEADRETERMAEAEVAGNADKETLYIEDTTQGETDQDQKEVPPDSDANSRAIYKDRGDSLFLLRQSDNVFQVEAAALREVHSVLLLPLVSKDTVLGMISLGPRLGDMPYSREDKRLLLSVAGPTTLALENARLVAHMIEDARRRQELEAENEQRAKELEEARQLQLSMLPKNLPDLPNVEIAAYMKTATEVGGDYYDFHLSDEGTLTVAVGDATGHGLKAGTMVTAMKSLFQCFAREVELVPVFNQSSRVLKQMNLRSLFMGLTMVKLQSREMKISSAGMPPVFICRAASGEVEEILMKTMPLGSIASYPYREEQVSLALGDVVLLMSDGLPERFNSEFEMFEYDRVRQVLAESAAFSPREIIARLADAGDRWANGRPQDDDITLVVLKLKS